MKTWWTIGLAVTASAAICGAAAAGATSDPVATTSTASTLPPAQSVPDSSIAPSTSTTLSPGAGAPVVTLVPLTPEEQEVVDALYAARTLVIEAYMDPEAAGLQGRLDLAFASGGQQRQTVEDNMAYLRANGLRARINAELPWILAIRSVDFFDEQYARAEVVTCYTDSSILYEPGGAPNGEDDIVNDSVSSRLLRYTMIREDGRWKAYWGFNLSEPAEGTECVDE